MPQKSLKNTKQETTIYMQRICTVKKKNNALLSHSQRKFLLEQMVTNAETHRWTT